MTDQQFHDQLNEILSKIENLPKAQHAAILAMAKDTRDRHRQVREATARAYAALDDWRLVQKYRIFDAEASLREEQAKRNHLENGE